MTLKAVVKERALSKMGSDAAALMANFRIKKWKEAVSELANQRRVAYQSIS